MILINFGHPLKGEILEEIQRVTGKSIKRIYDRPVKFDMELPFDAQAFTIVEEIGLSSLEWQTEQILVNPPSHPLMALTVIAELHGRMGYFTAVLRLKQQKDSVPPCFIFAEVLDLQAVRDQARLQR
jgi:hypothetical protein